MYSFSVPGVAVLPPNYGRQKKGELALSWILPSQCAPVDGWSLADNGVLV